MSDAGLIIGGWVLARAVATPSWLLPAVQLPQILTISECIQDDLPRPEPCLGDWFQDVGQAQDAAHRTPGPEPDVVTVAMLPEMAAAFMAEWVGERTPWFDLLRDGLPLAPDAQVIGFEVVGAEAYLDFHSWHCHAYAADVRTDLGVVLTERRLIPSLPEAHSILRCMLERPMAEAPKPVPWTVVALALP